VFSPFHAERLCFSTRTGIDRLRLNFRRTQCDDNFSVVNRETGRCLCHETLR
jgi:hypothetical protein